MKSQKSKDHNYKYFDKKMITDFSEVNIESKYDNGYVFTRLGKGVMHQIKPLRVDLNEFELTSENRRILKKNESLELNLEKLPFKNYTWKIGKIAQDFYKQFGDTIMSVNKIKELFTDPEKSNMNSVFKYTLENNIIGYCLCFSSKSMIHYSYPFYQLLTTNYSPNTGMAMMLKAILWAKENGKQYIYLGSDNKYKHQFKGLELFNGKDWNKI